MLVVTNAFWVRLWGLNTDFAEKKTPWRPVPDEINSEAQAIFVGLGPGSQEIELGRPFVGEAGLVVDNALHIVGKHRGHLSWVNTISCQPGEDFDLNKVHAKLNKINKARKAKGKEPLNSPIECCKPRLDRMLRTHTRIISAGAESTKAVLQKNIATSKLRGGTVVRYREADGRVVVEKPSPGIPFETLQIVPTVHPANTLEGRSPRMRMIFNSDIGKAFRWFENRLRWKDPKEIRNPSPAQLREFLFNRGHQWLLVDVETRAKFSIRKEDGMLIPGMGPKAERKKYTPFWSPLLDVLRMFGVGNYDEVYTVWFESLEGLRYYTDAELIEIRLIMAQFLSDPSITKVGHNFIGYDKPVLKQHFGVDVQPVLDTISLHRLVASEYEHGLAFIASYMTDIEAWKAGGEGDANPATASRTDHELSVYNVGDVGANAKIAPMLAQQVAQRGQAHLVEIDQGIQEACAGMHRNGILVDFERRAWWERKLQKEAADLLREIQEQSGKPNLNPSSTDQMAELLYGEWGIEPEVFSDKTGDPSTGKEALTVIFKDPLTTETQKEFLKNVTKYRNVKNKLLSTCVKPLKPVTEGGIVWADGRVRTTWKGHVPTSGRISSGDPINMQNQPTKLRDMYWAQPGCAIVGADYDQLELRLITAEADIQFYKDILRKGGDPHTELAKMVWKDTFLNAPGTKKEGKKGRMRTFAKTVVYASFYAAEDSTVFDMIMRAALDPDTQDKDKPREEVTDDEFSVANLTVKQVKQFRKDWLDVVPELPVWWEQMVQFWRLNGFVQDGMHKRRRDCLDGEELNTIVNHPIQSLAAAVINEATLKLVRDIPFGKWGPGTGLIAQVHDALYFEVPMEHCLWAARLIEKHMSVVWKGVPVTAGADIAKRWDGIPCIYPKGWRSAA